jgi:hypothetical protein
LGGMLNALPMFKIKQMAMHEVAIAICIEKNDEVAFVALNNRSPNFSSHFRSYRCEFKTVSTRDC